MAALDPVDRALAGARARRRAAAGSSRGACARRGSGCRFVLGSPQSRARLYLRYEIGPHLAGCVSCESPRSTAPATSGSRSAPSPTIDAPTDAVIKVTAGCICGSDLWPYRGENDITPGDTIGHEMVGVVEEVGSRGHLVPARRLRGRAVLPLRQHLPALPRRRAPRRASTSGSPPGDRGSTPRSPRPRAAWSRPTACPTPRCCPSLLTLSDVFPTGWHCAVVGRREARRHRGGRRRRRGRAVRRAGRRRRWEPSG